MNNLPNSTEHKACQVAQALYIQHLKRFTLQVDQSAQFMVFTKRTQSPVSLREC